MSDVHEEIRALMAAYALGAVPEEEMPPIRAHILSCEGCFAEAESYAETLVALSTAVDEHPVSDGFADRVMDAALGDRPASETAGPPRRRFRWSPGLALVGGALSLLLVATGVALVNTVEDRDRYRDVIAAMVHDRDAIELSGAGGAEGIVSSTDDGLVLVAVNLGEAPPDKDYQLWLMKDGVPTPADTFDVVDGLVIVESGKTLDGFDGAAVTVEPEGGSDQPTTQPVISG